MHKQTLNIDLDIDKYQYNLPKEKIAKFPLSDRAQSKLLVFEDGSIKDDIFQNITNHISPKTLMVFNNTRVIQARMIFHKTSGAQIEIFCLEPVEPAEYNLTFQQKSRVVWKCIVGNAKKWKDTFLTKRISYKHQTINLTVTKLAVLPDGYNIEFQWDQEIPFSEILEMNGLTPIPPYLNREAEALDKQRYQTVYSKQNGSVAAPTAGLHFTENILNQLAYKKIQKAEITLHVGAGTFKPVQTPHIDDHVMHTEHISISTDTLEVIIASLGNITAVGTTTMRTLESLYWIGTKIHQNKINSEELFLSQWEAYQINHAPPPDMALKSLKNYMNNRGLQTLYTTTQLIIVPGYDFKVVDTLITNYHMPKSTLLLLVAAFVGDAWKEIYEHALNNNYRFLSYGDGSLIRRHKA